MRTRNLITLAVSMVDGSFLDKLEAIAQFVRKDPRPFGGIQLILCGKSFKYCRAKANSYPGDFYQLPPVPDTVNGEKLPITFAFDSRTWSTCITEVITLRKVFRQADPGEYILLRVETARHIFCSFCGLSQPDAFRHDFFKGASIVYFFRERSEI